MIIAETERLQLREFVLSDADFIMVLLNSPGWLKFIGDRNINTQKQAELYLQNGPINSYTQNGFGLYMVQLKKTATPLGMCGLIKRDALPYPDLGFAFLPQFTGKGYAFEAGRSSIEIAKLKSYSPVLCAITDSFNQASQGLLKKLGFSYIKKIKLKGEENELDFFSMQLRD